MKTNCPLVSIIIPTWDSASSLEICLNSIKSQTYSNYEIIIVDNFSNDQTKEIAIEYKATFFAFQGERSAARNYGAIQAKGKFLIFLDSDISLTNTVLEECIDSAKNGIKAITFPELIEGEGFWAECRKLEAKCYLNDDTIEAPRFYEKDLFFSVGGFNENIYAGEDWDLREKVICLGHKIYHIKSFTFHHEGYVSFFRRIKKKYYYGKSLGLYLNQHNGVKQIPLFRKSYYRNWRLLISDPLHSFGFIILKMSESGVTLISMIANH